MSREERFRMLAGELGIDADGVIRSGGNYSPVVLHRGEAVVSGQIPRVGDQVVVVGRVGIEVSMEQAQRAAGICAMRALALLRRALGGLDGIERLLQLNVFIRCADDFTLHSEVADAASAVFHRVLGEAGGHARTSVGVSQLPKGAAVELDLRAAATDLPHPDKA